MFKRTAYATRERRSCMINLIQSTTISQDLSTYSKTKHFLLNCFHQLNNINSATYPPSACGDHQDRSRFWMFRRRCFKNTPEQDGRNKLSTLVSEGRKPLGPFFKGSDQITHFNQATKGFFTHFWEVNCIN